MNFKHINGLKKLSKCILMQFDGNAKPNPGNISCGIVFYSPVTNKLLYEYGYYEKASKNNNESELVVGNEPDTTL